MYRRMAVLLLLVMAFVAFGAQVQAQDDAHVLRAAVDQEPTSLNPYYTIQASAYMFIDLYLLKPWLMDDQIELTPILVNDLPINVEGGVTINDAGKTVVRYTLADWAVWSDGMPMTAADFIFPFEVSQDGLSNFVTTTFSGIESVEQGTTDKEVVVTFTSATSNWFNAGWYPLPDHVLRQPYEAAKAENKGLDTLDWNMAPTVGNGPFVFSEMQSGSFMRFTRSDNFHNPAWFESVIVSFYSDPTVMRAVLESGEVDIAHDFQPADVLDLRDNPDIVIDSKYDSGREAWWFNVGLNPNPAVLDVRVRRAIEMGLDRQLIVDQLLGGLTQVPNSFWDNTPYYNPDTPVIAYDPDGAKALLDEVGWRDEDGDGVREAHGVEGVDDGTPLVISLGTTTAPLRMDTQAVAQDMMAEIGIKLELRNYDGSSWATPFTDGGGFRGGFDDILQYFGYTAFAGIQPTAWFACNQIPSTDNPNGINTTHACDPDFDTMWTALGTTIDPAEQQRIANELQVKMAEDVLWIGLWNRPQLTVYRADLQNVRPGGQSPYWQVSEWQRVG